jgi:hypothetical protein
MKNEICQLWHKNEFIFEGTYEECVQELYRRQKRSVRWAVRVDGWKIIEKGN